MLFLGTSEACETVTEGRVGSAWTLRLVEDSWSLPAACAAALDEVAGLVAAQRRRFVSIETILSGTSPTSMSLARLAAMAGRVEKGLIERGVARPRIRIRELRFPAQSIQSTEEGRIIVRVDPQ